MSSGVLLVISGQDRLMWTEDEKDRWKEDDLDQCLLGGLSAHDAQVYLSKCGVHHPPLQKPTRLQQAIIQCCNESEAPTEISCHPFFLYLCAEIVLNERKSEDKGSDPLPDTFIGIPSKDTAKRLADRFLKSLHNRPMEMWVEELSLTPRFDDQAALVLDDERQYYNGRARWEQLKRYQFMEWQSDGFYRLHKIMCDALRTLLADDEGRTRIVHQWFIDHWTKRNEPALVFFQGRFDGCGVLNLLRENLPNKFGTPIFAPIKSTLKEH